MLAWVIKRPVLSGMLFLAILLLGIYSLKNTPVELVPDEKLPSLTITAFWYGAPAEMILERVALPVEEAIAGVKGVERIRSLCRENNLRMEVEFSRGTNMEFAYLLIKESLGRVKGELPPRARESLSVVPFVPKEFQKKPFLSVAIFSKLPLQSIRQIAEREFLPRLKGIAGVSHVELWGGAEAEVKVLLEPEKMRLYGIGVYDVYSAIGKEFYNLASVSVKKDGREISLSLSSAPSSISRIENIVLQTPQGTKIKLKEVGRVFLSSRKIREEKRYMGMPTVVLDIFKEKGASTISLASRLKREISGIEERLAGVVRTRIIEDESQELKERLTKLIKLSLLILALIFSILFLVFRQIKPSLLVFSSVIFSVFASFTVIYLLKIPVNLLTLSGFALGFGMFVDNAVVVFENIMRLREGGMGRDEAAVEGANGVVLPVLASTATTIIVFFSFAYFQGRLRIYYLPLAYTITIALVSSVFVAFTLIPSLSARMELRRKKREIAKGGKLFKFGLKYPLFILIPIGLLFFFSAKIFYKNVSFGRFFSWYQKQKLEVWVSLPPGASFEDTKKTILQFEKMVLSQPYKKEVKTEITGNTAFMEVEFPREVEFSPKPYILKQELIQLATNMAGIGIGVWGFDPQGYYYSPSVGSWLPYSILIRGYDFLKIKGLSNALKNNLLMNRRVSEVRVVYERRALWGGGGKYYSIKLRQRRLREYGINPRNFLYLLGSLIGSQGIIQKIKLGQREISLEVREAQQEPELDELLSAEFMSSRGVPYRVSDVVEIKEEKTKGGIERENQQYLAIVQWDYLGSYKRGRAFLKTVYKNLRLPPGFTKSLEMPAWWMSGKELSQLKMALVASLILIFILLSILYESLLQPIVVMFSIPLALIGVFLGFVIADFPFDSTAYIGLILLFGIVVNNAIILVDHTNGYLRKGFSPEEAAVRGARERLRPIFITSATTVLGMLPLVVFHRGGQTDIWTTLALCTVGGLTASALLVPLVIPIFYSLSFKIKERLF